MDLITLSREEGLISACKILDINIELSIAVVLPDHQITADDGIHLLAASFIDGSALSSGQILQVYIPVAAGVVHPDHPLAGDGRPDLIALAGHKRGLDAGRKVL